MNRKISTIFSFVVILLCSAIFLSIFLYSYESYKNAAASATYQQTKTN